MFATRERTRVTRRRLASGREVLPATRRMSATGQNELAMVPAEPSCPGVGKRVGASGTASDHHGLSGLPFADTCVARKDGCAQSLSRRTLSHHPGCQGTRNRTWHICRSHGVVAPCRAPRLICDDQSPDRTRHVATVLLAWLRRNISGRSLRERPRPEANDQSRDDRAYKREPERSDATRQKTLERECVPRHLPRVRCASRSARGPAHRLGLGTRARRIRGPQEP